MSKKFEEMDIKEVKKSLNVFFELLNANKIARRKINDKLFAPNTLYSERNKLEAKKLELTGELIKIDEKLGAFQANQLAINPPSDAQIQNIKNLANEIDTIIVQTQTVDAIVVAAKGVMDETQKLKQQMAI